MDSGKSPLSNNGAKGYPSPPPEDLEPAPLCAVVHISTHDFWLTADVGYHTSSIWKSFSDVEVTCAAERPEFELFMDDYIMVSDNLRWLQESIETPGFQVKKGLFLLTNNTGACFKVHHALFELKNHEGFNSTDDSAGDGPSEDSEDIQDEESSIFNIRNWPTYSDMAKNALDTIKETHNVVPIPAYDLSGHLIKP
ncbi:hypothetical protein EDC04DRAFT_2607813 [Pisolithus marmoratus]|nr:hypothetical protein EDC04DRAFT_2607813 [Pisolithus marmoratus]